MSANQVIATVKKIGWIENDLPFKQAAETVRSHGGNSERSTAVAAALSQ
jgi:hypothetical protein